MSQTPLTSCFKIRVGAVVFDADNRLLLVRQNNRPFWVLPGGTLEPGETIAECIIREIKEEAALDITLKQLLFVADFFTPTGGQVLDVVFLAHFCGGQLIPEETENINEMGFFTLEAVQQLDTKPQLAFDQIRSAWQNNLWPMGIYLGCYRS